MSFLNFHLHLDVELVVWEEKLKCFKRARHVMNMRDSMEKYFIRDFRNCTLNLYTMVTETN